MPNIPSIHDLIQLLGNRRRRQRRRQLSPRGLRLRRPATKQRRHHIGHRVPAWTSGRREREVEAANLVEDLYGGAVSFALPPLRDGQDSAELRRRTSSTAYSSVALNSRTAHRTYLPDLRLRQRTTAALVRPTQPHPALAHHLVAVPICALARQDGSLAKVDDTIFGLD